MKIYDSTPLKTKCADKIKLHDYCIEKLGFDLCIPILHIYDKVEDIDWGQLPEQFVIKCNHGSGMNIIVKDKSTLNIQQAENKLNRFMKDDFAFHVGYEMHYHDIPHKIFVEEYKNDGNKDLIDYKFLCFNGEPRYCQIIGGRNDKTRHLNYYDMDFNFVNISRYDFQNNENIHDKKPENFDLMVEYSKKLSEDFKFVRVDFYEVNGKVYLGELTFTPGAGFFRYKNESDNKLVGDMLDLGEIHKKESNEKKPVAQNAIIVNTADHFKRKKQTIRDIKRMLRIRHNG
jgi:hypothetical protein